MQSSDTRGEPHPTSLSYPTFFDFRRARIFAGIACYHSTQLTLEGRDGPRVVEGQIVSSNLFGVLGVRPALGRGFVEADESRNARVVIFSDGLWRAQFGGDPSIIGGRSQSTGSRTWWSA